MQTSSRSGSVRILIINPNTNPAVTERVKQAALARSAPGVEIEVVNPQQGPVSIESVEERQQAEDQVLGLLWEKRYQGYDAYLMACFDDLALEQARRIVQVPVLGTCEPSIAAAKNISKRFSVITTVHQAVPGIEALMRHYDAGQDCTVRAAGIGVAQAAQGGEFATEPLLAAAWAALREDGAEAILLASGGLTGYGEALSESIGVPVVDGVYAAIDQTLKVAKASRL